MRTASVMFTSIFCFSDSFIGMSHNLSGSDPPFSFPSTIPHSQIVLSLTSLTVCLWLMVLRPVNNITRSQLQLCYVTTDKAELRLMGMSLDLKIFHHNRNTHIHTFDPMEMGMGNKNVYEKFCSDLLYSHLKLVWLLQIPLSCMYFLFGFI